MKKLIHRTEKVKKLTDEELGECSADIYTVWPGILAGNLFWRISSFESNPPIFLLPKFHSSGWRKPRSIKVLKIVVCLL